MKGDGGTSLCLRDSCLGTRMELSAVEQAWVTVTVCILCGKTVKKSIGPLIEDGDFRERWVTEMKKISWVGKGERAV